MTAHQRMALLAAFRPATLIDETRTPARRVGTSDKVRLHFDGHMSWQGRTCPVNVCVTLGGIWTAPLVSAAAYDLDGPPTETIVARALSAFAA